MNLNKYVLIMFYEDEKIFLFVKNNLYSIIYI